MLSAGRATIMLLKEFAERTGFEPTYKYFFEVIHPEYMQTDQDKDEFCRQWKRKGGFQRAYDAMCVERNEQQEIAFKYKRAFEETKDALDEAWGRINRLTYKLDMIKDVINNQ